jgi:hypothetical protein
MIEIGASVLIVERNETYKTPFTIELPPGTYTLKATYGTEQKEDVAVITTGQTTRVDFTFAPQQAERKGQSSLSNIVTVTVNPQLVEKEPTTLTLASDKSEYVSDDSINLSGKLVFTSDQVPLAGRTIKVYENDTEIATTVTDGNGGYALTLQAPIVQESTTFNYKAVFGGD